MAISVTFTTFWFCRSNSVCLSPSQSPPVFLNWCFDQGIVAGSFQARHVSQRIRAQHCSESKLCGFGCRAPLGTQWNAIPHVFKFVRRTRRPFLPLALGPMMTGVFLLGSHQSCPVYPIGTRSIKKPQRKFRQRILTSCSNIYAIFAWLGKPTKTMSISCNCLIHLPWIYKSKKMRNVIIEISTWKGRIFLIMILGMFWHTRVAIGLY